MIKVVIHIEISVQEGKTWGIFTRTDIDDDGISVCVRYFPRRSVEAQT